MQDKTHAFFVGTNPMQARRDREVHRSASKDGGGKNLKKRRVFGSVICSIHGAKKTATEKLNILEVYVGAPRTRAERVAGCPMCAAAARRLAAKQLLQ